MGLEKHEKFIKKAKSTLVFEPGWSEDNLTGAWRSERPEVDQDKCNNCDICWLVCPDACVKREGDKIEIDLKYCKGCGICAEECLVKAIIMVREESD
ncbi:MAG: hypothetical protein V3U09_02965 [Thermoplasmata archaeon]